MNNKSKLFVSSLFILAAHTSSAKADGLFDIDLCPYVGAEVSWRHQSFPAIFGGNILKKNYPQGDVYAGIKLNNYLGLQLGFEGVSSQHKPTTFTNASVILGRTVDSPVSFDQHQTSMRLYGFHADVMGFYPFSICNEHFNLVASIGLANKRVTLKDVLTIENGVPIPLGEIANVTRTFAMTKCVPRLGLGVQYMLTNCAGVRLMGQWENTARFKNIKTKDGLGTFALRNATSLGFGAFYNF